MDKKQSDENTINKYALISVFDKTGIDELSAYLSMAGYTIIATGNTYNYLKNIAGIKLKKIDEITNFPEILSGRVKTLHPAVFGGILSLREDKNHLRDLAENSINFIDFVIVNLYPFKEMKDKDITFDEKLEYIDIGGVSLLRAAAKNFKYVTVLSDPRQYAQIIPYLKICSDKLTGESNYCGQDQDDKDKFNNMNNSENTTESINNVNNKKNVGTVNKSDSKNNKNAEIPLSIKFGLAAEVFKQTSEYDGEIFSFLNLELNSEYKSRYNNNLISNDVIYEENGNFNINGVLNSKSLDDESLILKLNKTETLRYGENPHQQASFYNINIINNNISSNNNNNINNNKMKVCINPTDLNNLNEIGGGTNTNFVKLSGKAISYNNLLDIDSCLDIIRDFYSPPDKEDKQNKENNNNNNKENIKEYFSVIVKHTNPCGAAISGISLKDAFIKAKKADELSSFGGIIGFNGIIDEETALEIKPMFVEVIVAPDFKEEALGILKSKKNTIIIKVSEDFILSSSQVALRSAAGGILIQEKDIQKDEISGFKVVSDIKPDESQFNDLIFAWKIAKHVKSNAIVYAKDGVTRGIGAGQMSRIDSAKFAYEKMLSSYGSKIEECVMASDGFFSFKDSIEYAKKLGISAIIEPGGSIRDNEVIEEANKSKISIVFTGIRHFKH
ncbi:MAG: bifunctional phosphoribosylaminoimidazolecarboxamide formyltransferase/inosine monophosphate cyclohydrolase [bacterium]